MIKIKKNNESSWTVFNTKTHKCADIIKIFEHSVLINYKPKYRVDVNGFTVRSMIENFQTAKGTAYAAVKGDN